MPSPQITNTLVWVLACMLLAVGCKKQESRVATSQTIEVTAVKVEPRDEGKDRGQIKRACCPNVEFRFRELIA
jgi:hypothetical protein